MIKDADDIVAALAVDYWKLLRSFERLANDMPEGRSSRLQAQARFSAGRLMSHLEVYGLQIETFEGQEITPTMPVVAVNADDLSGRSNVIVESTIEPAVVAGARVILMGRVVATSGNA